MPSEENFMSMEEFFDLVTNSRLESENFGTRECGIIFTLSMSTQIDEIKKERHIKMKFLEFLEAFCRLAEKLSKKDIYKALDDDDFAESITESEESSIGSNASSMGSDNKTITLKKPTPNQNRASNMQKRSTKVGFTPVKTSPSMKNNNEIH